MEVHSFLGLVGHYQRFIKEFACITQPLSEYLTGEGARRKLEQVSITEEAMRASEALKSACMTVAILVFANYTKLFLLETDASKDGLGGSVVTEADRWAVSPHCLWQQSLNTLGKELSINQT